MILKHVNSLQYNPFPKITTAHKTIKTYQNHSKPIKKTQNTKTQLNIVRKQILSPETIVFDTFCQMFDKTNPQCTAKRTCLLNLLISCLVTWIDKSQGLAAGLKAAGHQFAGENSKDQAI